MATTTRNHKNDPYHAQSQHGDLQQKQNTTKFGSIFNFNMLSAIMDDTHYLDSQKRLPSLTESI